VRMSWEEAVAGALWVDEMFHRIVPPPGEQLPTIDFVLERARILVLRWAGGWGLGQQLGGAALDTPWSRPRRGAGPRTRSNLSACLCTLDASIVASASSPRPPARPTHHWTRPSSDALYSPALKTTVPPRSCPPPTHPQPPRFGIRGLIIDPYNELDHRRPSHVTETEFVSQMLARVKRFAQAFDVHVWLVAHPRQLQDWRGEAPNLYDVSGRCAFGGEGGMIGGNGAPGVRLESATRRAGRVFLGGVAAAKGAVDRAAEGTRRDRVQGSRVRMGRGPCRILRRWIRASM
jgi:hypothetical protein